MDQDKRDKIAKEMRRQAIKQAKFEHVAKESGLVYQTVSKFYEGGKVLHSTQEFIAVGTRRSLVKQIEKLIVAAQHIETLLPYVDDWIKELGIPKKMIEK